MRLFPLPARPWFLALLAACGLSFAGPACAQDMPGGARLGMTAEQLQQAVPAVAKVARPVRMQGGLAGSWSAPPVAIAGTAFVPTFFFAGGQLRRIEYLASPGDAAAAFDAVRAWGRAQWGPELVSESPEASYATWTGEAMDAVLQATNAPQRDLRLVIRRRVAKDGSEL